MSDELKDVLKASDRYKKFTLPDKPACFKDMFKGNPNLKRARIDNIDLRWEWFPSKTEQILAGVFYKYLKDPIEQVFVTSDGKIGAGTDASRSMVTPDTRCRTLATWTSGESWMLCWLITLSTLPAFFTVSMALRSLRYSR